MNIDDLLCVGATDKILLSSTTGRNKNLVPGEVISAIINGTEELLETLRNQGIGIHSTGGETADVGDLVRTIIVDSTVVPYLANANTFTNTITANSFIPTSSTVPTNGLYLPAANTLGLATNSTLRIRINN